MTRTTWILVGMAMATVVGCSENHVRGTDAGPVLGTDARPVLGTDAPIVLAPDAPEPITEALTFCLREGRVREIGVVDNNDSADHGALLRFELSDEGLLAAAGEDGTLKLWTLEAELLETFDGTILTYGPEIPSAPIADLAFDGESILAGDVRGIVLQMERGGGLWPIGGTTPEIAIRAIAFDPETRRLAHAQSGPDVANLTIRAEDGTTTDVTTDVLVSDLLFTPSGTLLIAGERAGFPVIETRDASMTVVGEAVTLDVPGAFLEIASEGGQLAAVTPGYVLFGSTIPLPGGRSVDLVLGEGGNYALVAGTRGLDVLDADGAITFHQDGPAVGVRVDASGRFIVLGGSDARIHVLGCAP